MQLPWMIGRRRSFRNASRAPLRATTARALLCVAAACVSAAVARRILAEHGKQWQSSAFSFAGGQRSGQSSPSLKGFLAGGRHLHDGRGRHSRLPVAQKPVVRTESIDLTEVDEQMCSIDEPENCAGAGDWPWLDAMNKWVGNGAGTYLLCACALVSLALANAGPVRNSWLSFWSMHYGPAIGGHALGLKDWVNEGLMSFYFFFVGLEIKMELTEGALNEPSKAFLPVVAALGGMVVPMLVYALVNVAVPGGSMAGVSIPMATDIACAVAVYQAFRRHMPPSTGAFLLALATVDDLGAIFVIAVFFAKAISVKYLVASFGALCCASGMLLVGMKRTAFAYFIPGFLLWYCMLRSGVNADISGVITALCIPMYSEKGDEVVERLINRWSPFCNLVILPIFALANCAVSFAGGATGGAASPLAISSGVVAGLLVGKPLGIFLFTWVAVKLGMGSMPTGMTKRHLGIVGILGSIGFTMCLFLIENSLTGAGAQFSKVGVFVASTISAVAAGVMMSRLPQRNYSDDMIVGHMHA